MDANLNKPRFLCADFLGGCVKFTKLTGFHIFTFGVESRRQWSRSVISWCTRSRQQIWKRTTSSRGAGTHAPWGTTSFAGELVPTLCSGAGTCTSSTDKLGEQVRTWDSLIVKSVCAYFFSAFNGCCCDPASDEMCVECTRVITLPTLATSSPLPLLYSSKTGNSNAPHSRGEGGELRLSFTPIWQLCCPE